MVDSVVIVSGGMDSVTLLHYLCKRMDKTPAVLSFTYGQKHMREIDFAKMQVAELGLAEHLIVDLTPLTPAFSASALVSAEIDVPHIDDVKGDPQPVTYVPNRNMIFLSIAAAYAESRDVSEIYYGAQAQDLYGYWDTTPDFLTQINAVLQLNRKTKLEILAPLVEYSKTDVLRLGNELNIDYGKTWSCYNGAEKACGTCPTCMERLNAFKALDSVDPLPYQDL